ncbi:MAG: prepilin-type N-terminal cleavage/methylation domain-containing protein [Acidobacteria bacterium]|nr:prepilin-type N-terminal cleavage/methylation domain-containing protein [Acidobacteriota bacterium]
MQTVSDRKDRGRRGEAGFSLVELLVAIGVTLVIMVVATRLLAMSMFVRQRENQRAEAVADVQRALQAMSREISNAGLGLSNNGLVADDSDDTSIRIRSNLNAICTTNLACDSDTADAGEDVVYAIISDTDDTGVVQRLITRQDINSGNAISQLANRIDNLQFVYVKPDGTTTLNASQAQKVKITVTVTLRAVGKSGQPGYQPPSQTELVSEVVLRNLLLNN